MVFEFSDISFIKISSCFKQLFVLVMFLVKQSFIYFSANLISSKQVVVCSGSED